MSERSDGDPAPESSGDSPAEHALPPQFVVTLFAALLGGLVPGIYMSVVSAPGNVGSPIFGLLLPWSVFPFVLAVVAGWRSRRSPNGNRLKQFTLIGAVLGLGIYTYVILFHPRGVRNFKVFLWLPLWQWLLLAGPILRATFGRSDGNRDGKSEIGDRR